MRHKNFLYLLSTVVLTFCMIIKTNSQSSDSRPKIINNPIIPDVGMADPHIRVFNNKAYLYATRDEDKTAKTFIMPDWKIWSSEDLIHWKLETTIDPTETYMGASKRCWAPDAAYKNGKYYFYFSNGNTDTGVMVGDTPIGPFKDALGKPLLPKDLTPVKEYDPSILIDDDPEKSAYIAFGHHRINDPAFYFCIAKLNEDMVSLAEKPRKIKFISDKESEVLKGNDKPTLHKHNGIYYLSAGSHYATSKNVYGPYTIVGNSGNDQYGLNSRAHGNYFDWNHQSFHTWCHFHLGKDVARYRESYISYLHYRDNGEMVTDTDFLDAHFSYGVGQYDVSWNKIEAEWFMAAQDVEKKESLNKGFEIQNIKNGARLHYPNIQGLDISKKITFKIASEQGGVIEIRADSKDGKIIGTCQISSTGGFTQYKDFVCELRNHSVATGIYLIFKGKGEDLLHLDSFSFN